MNVEERDEMLRKDIENGMSIYKASKKYNMSVAWIYNKLEKWGVRSQYLSGKEGKAIKEWRQLTKNRSYPSRILSLPSCFIKELGFDPNEELMGSWKIKNGELVLEIRKR